MVPSNQQSEGGLLASLGVLIGQWDMVAQFPSAVGSDAIGTTVFEWTLNEKFVTQRGTVHHPDAPDVFALIGLNATGDRFTQHYFDSRGVHHDTPHDRVDTPSRTPDFTRLDFAQRFTGVISEDGQTIEGHWETRHDSIWDHDFIVHFRKIT